MIVAALSPVTLGQTPPIREFVGLAEQSGFGGVEIGIDDVIALAEESSWESAQALFEQYEVAPAVFGLPVRWRDEEKAFSTDLLDLPHKCEAARMIGCSRTCTWLPPAISSEPDEFRRLITHRFSLVANVLAEFDIRLGLEFVGPETLRTGPHAMGPHPFIYTLPQTMSLIEAMDVKVPNVGILLDSFHWFTTHGTTNEIVMMKPDQIVHVHINDAPDRPLAQQIDGERLLPGEGVIDLKGFLGALKDIKYNGYAAVETFSADLSKLGPAVAAERAGEAAARVLSLPAH